MGNEKIMLGFLDERAAKGTIEYIVAKNKIEFRFANKINDYAYSLYNKIDNLIKPKQHRTDYIIGNYVLLHKSYQSAVILLQNGLQNDAKIIMRTMYEKLVYMKCVDLDDVYYHMLRKSDCDSFIRKIELAEKEAIESNISKSDLCKIKNLTNKQIEYSINYINKNQGEAYTSKSKFKISDFAKIAKMEKEYNLPYRLLSESIHSTISSIEKQFVIENEFICDFNPVFKDNHYYIQTLVDIMISALKLSEQHFDIHSDELTKLYNEELYIWTKNTLLISNLGKLHTTDLGVKRIKENLSLSIDDVVGWCRQKIEEPNSKITKTGKNWYVETTDCKITINANSYTIITAHKLKR